MSTLFPAMCCPWIYVSIVNIVSKFVNIVNNIVDIVNIVSIVNIVNIVDIVDIVDIVSSSINKPSINKNILVATMVVGAWRQIRHASCVTACRCRCCC